LQTKLQLIKIISSDNTCLYFLGRGKDISNESSLPRVTSVRISPDRSSATPSRTGDAGLRGTRTDCPRQNFLNYPAASRNNSSDSNSVVYEAGPTSPATNKPGQDGRHYGIRENVRGSGGGVFTK